MKRLLLILFLLATTRVAAQTDFSNDYYIVISGDAFYNGDLSMGCGSRVDVWVDYQDGQRVAIMLDQHGGGHHNFVREIKFTSTNKIIGIATHTNVYRQGSSFSSCGSRHNGEGTAYIKLDTTTMYPCLQQQYAGKFPFYDGGSYIKVDLKPLTSLSAKVTVKASWFNDYNQGVPPLPCNLVESGSIPFGSEKFGYVYNMSDNFGVTLFGGSFDTFGGGQNATAQGVRWYADVKSLQSLNLSSQSSAYAIIQPTTLCNAENCCEGWVETSASKVTPINPLDPKGPPVTMGLQLHPGTPDGYIQLTPEPYAFPVKYGGGTGNILPYDQANRIVILGPRGNPASFYHWVYSTDGVDWTNLPAQYQGKHRLQISGYDLMGTEFYKYHYKNLFFKLIVDCTGGGESSILTLSGRMSAPNILSVAPMPDRCYDTPYDGSFTITFNRPLLNVEGNQETLMISVRDLSNQNPTDQIQDVALDATNSFTWPRRLQSDRTYEVSLIGSFLGAFTYSDDPLNHYRTFALVRPTPVASAVTPQAVHCYGGADGKFVLQAQGGAGNYSFDFGLTTDPAPATIPMGVETIYSRELLAPATYRVHVKDGNGCGDKDGAKDVIINQPAAPLAIAYSNIVNPLGYGYTDGYIETILTGGTSFADKSYTVEWYDDQSNLLPAGLYANQSLSQGYEAELDSVGDGFYTLRAYDSQYNIAHPDHRAGCMVVSELFHVIQPPPLVVTLREHHFVTCNGYGDGQVAAHVIGGMPFTSGLPYTYTWFRMDGNAEIPLQQSDSIAGQLKAGIYRLLVTDKNNVPKRSVPFTLVQPDVLAPQVLTTPVSCKSGIDGTASAPVTGGTAPYEYLWSYNDYTTANISQLFEGVYFVLVTDFRGCTATASGRVNTPALLQVDSVLTNPQCVDYTNGRIAIAVTQGTAPYQYEWNTGATTEAIDNLAAGTYTVSIIDNNACRTYRSYTLVDPQPVTVDLGHDRFLCNSQVYQADATLPNGAAYRWTGSNGFIADTPAITIEQAGTYTVQVTTTEGCLGGDALQVQRVQADVASEFIISTQAFAGQEVTLLNISNPQPDSVQWGFDAANVRVTEKQQRKAVIVFPEEGSYPVYMTAFRQGCEVASIKTVTVLARAFQDAGELYNPFIVDFTVSPNPVQGDFLVNITLLEAVAVRLRMISVGTNAIVSDRQEYGNSQYTLPYSTGSLAVGTYILLLETAKGNALLKVMVY